MKLKFRRLEVQFLSVLLSTTTVAAQTRIAFAEQYEPPETLTVLPPSQTVPVDIAETPPKALIVVPTGPAALPSVPESGLEALGAGVLQDDEFRAAIKGARKAGIKVEEIPGSFAATFPEANELAKVIWKGSEGCSEGHLLTCYAGQTVRDTIGFGPGIDFYENPTLTQALVSSAKLWTLAKLPVLGNYGFVPLVSGIGGVPSLPPSGPNTNGWFAQLLQRAKEHPLYWFLALLAYVAEQGFRDWLNYRTLKEGATLEGTKLSLEKQKSEQQAILAVSEKCNGYAGQLATNSGLNRAQRQMLKDRLLTECSTVKKPGTDLPAYDQTEIRKLDENLVRIIRDNLTGNQERNGQAQEYYDMVTRGTTK